jgi:hypothetical protein
VSMYWFLTPGMSPKLRKALVRTISVLLLEEFAHPSIRRELDGYGTQETEKCGPEKTVHR